MRNVYRVTRNEFTQSYVAKSKQHAAIIAVKHIIPALVYKCNCKTVNGLEVYEVTADNFYIDVTVTQVNETQGALL
jgi:hypothetical protein